MSLAVIHTRARLGIEAPLVTVEAHLSNGLPALNIVGLPEAAVRESKDRVRSAIMNSQFEFPTRRITINLAPADLPKEGGRYDLAIALGILAASDQIPSTLLEDHEFLGEVALSGQLRGVPGVLPAALATRAQGRTLIVPSENADEANLPSGAKTIAGNTLLEICAYLQGDKEAQASNTQAQQTLSLHKSEPSTAHTAHIGPDLNEVKGQHQAKRALTIAAAGGHSLLMYGPPGTGKTMLASRLPSILPPMSEEEALQSAAIVSISGKSFDPAIWLQRPFRAPHHTASAVALVGGGSTPKPGEISLAHNGVLFLDELPEFDRKVLEVLREPLESGSVVISRAASQAHFPAKFQLITAMNPCPCGYLGDTNHRCQCSDKQIKRYKAKLSGPLMDRIDLHINVPALSHGELTKASETASSQQIQHQVNCARNRQLTRQGKINSALSSKEVDHFCALEKTQALLMEKAAQQLGFSARAYHRILRVARSIADLEESERLSTQHLTEALHYRPQPL
ncbi:MAG: ATP-dependent protease [Gammaproteobacteria bacterium]|nr:MAG: ATP-dependent protease [Gammaproteobacteria bacterium]